MGAAFLVVGSDTSVGKTVFSGLLGKYIRLKGFRLNLVKPFCSGGRKDVEFLQAANNEIDQEKINYWYTGEPISPAAWELRSNKEIEFTNLLSELSWNTEKQNYDILLVEGVGGLLAPITSEFTVASLGQELGCNLIIIAANRVGVINHVLLTVEAALNRGLSVICIILIGQEGPDATAADNKELIGLHLPHIPGFKGVFEFPWLGEGADDPKLITINVKKAEVVLDKIFHKVITPFLMIDSNS